MFCPKCGQEQVAEVPNFCSRCGFQLTEVTSLVARGGAPAEPQTSKPPRDRARRYGLRLLLTALASFVVALFSAATDGDASIAIFGFLTFASFVVGIATLIYSWIKGRMRRRSESTPLVQQTSRVQAPHQGELLPAYAPPTTVPRARFDTGDLAEPPSVTEVTTRHLEHEPPSEHKQTR
jgi:hypothetical protein